MGKTVAVKQAIAQLLADGVAPHAIVRVAADGWSAADLRTVVSNVALPPVAEGTRRWWFNARLRAQDKLYAVDPLVGRLPHLRNPAHRDLDPTVTTEMQIGMSLHRAAYAAGTPWADDQFLFYVRTAARKEIDFVGEPPAGLFAYLVDT